MYYCLRFHKFITKVQTFQFSLQVNIHCQQDSFWCVLSKLHLFKNLIFKTFFHTFQDVFWNHLPSFISIPAAAGTRRPHGVGYREEEGGQSGKTRRVGRHQTCVSPHLRNQTGLDSLQDGQVRYIFVFVLEYVTYVLCILPIFEDRCCCNHKNIDSKVLLISQ